MSTNNNVGKNSIAIDETTFKILDILSRQIGNSISINELKNEIDASYGSAYYATIYNKLRSLTEEQITKKEAAGKAFIPTLNFKNSFTNDLLTQTDIWKKQEILRKHPELKMLLSDIYTKFTNLIFIRSMSIINPEYNLRLNKSEFLILLDIPEDDQNANQRRDGAPDWIITVHKRLQDLQKLHNIRINRLILTGDEFTRLIRSTEANPLREMLPKRINFLSPEAFWTEIMIASEEKGLRIKFEKEEIDPSEILEEDLVYNLARFGYKELGTTLSEGKDICIEYIIAAILLKGDARRIESIPILLAKNDPIYNLLIFLCQKYDCLDKLLGLLKALDKNKSTQPLKSAINILESIGIRETPADEQSVKEKLVLYSVVSNQ
jgi:hypothetical protein